MQKYHISSPSRAKCYVCVILALFFLLSSEQDKADWIKVHMSVKVAQVMVVESV